MLKRGRGLRFSSICIIAFIYTRLFCYQEWMCGGDGLDGLDGLDV